MHFGGTTAVVSSVTGRVVALAVGPWVIPTTSLRAKDVRAAVTAMRRQWGGPRLALQSGDGPPTGKALAAAAAVDMAAMGSGSSRLQMAASDSRAGFGGEHSDAASIASDLSIASTAGVIDVTPAKALASALTDASAAITAAVRDADMLTPLASAVTVPEHHPVLKGWRRFQAYVEGRDTTGQAVSPALSVATGQLAPMRRQWRDNILAMLPRPPIEDGEALAAANATLRVELEHAKTAYEHSLRRATLVYALRSPAERERLRIPCLPHDASVASQRWEWGGTAEALRGRLAGPTVPLSWSTRSARARTRLVQGLYGLSAVSRQLVDRWMAYRSAGAISLLVDVPRTDAEALQGWRPQPLKEFVYDQLRHAATTRQSLLERWTAQAEQTVKQFLQAYPGAPVPVPETGAASGAGAASSTFASASGFQGIGAAAGVTVAEAAEADAAWADIRMHAHVAGMWAGPEGFLAQMRAEVEAAAGPEAAAQIGFDADRMFASASVALSLQLREVCEESLAALMAFLIRFARRRQRLRLPALVAAARRRVRRRIAEERRRDAELERQRRADRRKERERAAARAALERRKATYKEGSRKATQMRGVLSDERWKQLNAEKEAEETQDAEEVDADADADEGGDRGLFGGGGGGGDRARWLKKLPPRQRRALQRRQKALNALKRGVAVLKRMAGLHGRGGGGTGAGQQHAQSPPALTPGMATLPGADGAAGGGAGGGGQPGGRRRSLARLSAAITGAARTGGRRMSHVHQSGGRGGGGGGGGDGPRGSMMNSVLVSMLGNQHSSGVQSAAAGFGSEVGESMGDDEEDEDDERRRYSMNEDADDLALLEAMGIADDDFGDDDAGQAADASKPLAGADGGSRQAKSPRTGAGAAAGRRASVRGGGRQGRRRSSGEAIRRLLADALLTDEGVAPLIGAPQDEDNVLPADEEAVLLLRRGFLEQALGLSFTSRLWDAVLPRGAALVALAKPVLVPASIAGKSSIGMSDFDLPHVHDSLPAGVDASRRAVWAEALGREAARAAAVAVLTADINGCVSADPALEAARRGGAASLSLLEASSAPVPAGRAGLADRLRGALPAALPDVAARFLRGSFGVSPRRPRAAS
jgi:hypothetical protein